MKTLLIAALMVLESGATMKKHHHQNRHHHAHGHHHVGSDLNMAASLAQQGHQSKAFQSRDFFKHRNMLNEREHENVQMYDTLNDKLTDETYIGQAIENNEKNNVKNSTLIQINSKEKGPFDRDTNPFEQFRNGPPSDGISLNGRGPFDRNNNPFEQFRTPPNYGPILVNTTTRKSSSTITTTTKTITTGSTTVVSRNYTQTKSKYVLTDGFEAVKCADEGQVCSCLGQIHFGKKADSFSAMHDDFVSIFDARDGARGYMTCDRATFNQTNSAQGGHQCYCVREMAPTPLPDAQHCANDAGLEFCDCFGTVYYGQRKDKASGKDMSFAEMMKGGWTSVISNGQLLCDQNSFDGDPVYGHDKQCFCAADPSYEPMPPVEHCANENEECICQGTVYYGRRDCPFDNVPVDFMEMQEFGYSSRTVEGAIGCNSFEFSDPFGHDVRKQCFCEADQTPQVKRCSMQDGTCQCKGGNIYYGLLESEGKSPISFDEMLESGNFAYKWDVNGDYGCNSHTFGSDPQPGLAKQCFCDDIGYEDLECIQEQLTYWQQTMSVQTLTTQISSSWSSSYTTYSSSTSYSRSSSTRIIEEETRYQQESEYQLRMQEEQRMSLQREIEMSGSMTSTTITTLESQYKIEEQEMTAAEMAEKEAEIKAETLRKAAEAADSKSKYEAQLAAQKAEAEATRLRREAEFKRQKAEADAAKIKKEKMKLEMAAKNKLAQLELQAIRTARQAKIRAEKQKMRLESQKLLEQYEANRAATEAARTQEALTKQLEEAMARQRELALERAAEKEERREKKNKKMQLQWEYKQRLAQEQEERQIAIERARELELERIHNQTIAQKERQAALEAQKKAEEERIKAEEVAALKQQREIEAQQLKALRAQALASTEADIKEAQELADKLAEDMEKSRKLRQKLLDEKRELAAHVSQQKAEHEQLVQDQEKAEKQLKLAKEMLVKKKQFTQKLKTETYQFVQKMKVQMEKTRKAAEDQMARLRKEAEEARIKREAAAKAAREADEKEHDASLEARKKLNQLQKEQHEREMAAKKAEFEKTFKHLWGPGTTGLSIVYATFDTKEMADKVIQEVYKDTMISQVTNYPGVTYEFKNETKLHIGNPGLQVRTDDARVEMITSDDRIPELIETCIAVSQNDNLDIVVVQMEGVSPDYAKWVALQSTEQDQTDAYYNVDPFSEIKPVADKKVKCKCDFCPCPMTVEEAH